MQEKILNVTNGDCFNKYFITQFGGVALPFCEAIMDGEVVQEIYSKEFIKLRSNALNVSENEYRNKMHVHNALSKNAYSTICLWFGKDTFCQMNLLTILAYLEQKKYQGKLILNYIDDQTFAVIEKDIDVKLGIYNNIYKEILLSKSMPKDLGVLHATAVNLFFDYRSNGGFLSTLIKNNANMDKRELICLLLKESKSYGLSDLQAERLIASTLSSR